MSIVKRRLRRENESLVVASLAPTEWITSIDSRGFMEIISGLGPTALYDPCEGSSDLNEVRRKRAGYRDSRGAVHRLDNYFLHCIVAMSTNSRFWANTERRASHPLVRASIALNRQRILVRREGFVTMSLRDKSSIVREAAKSNLERRPMRTSNVTGVSPAVADLSVAYLTLLEELYHLVSAYHAVTVQIQELTLSLRAVHRDLTESVTDQLQRMKTYSARITETIDALFPKLQSVMFMLHQVECASEIKNHLAHFNDSGVDAVVAKLPTLMADAASEIDQLYREADIEVSMLSNMNEIDRLLALKSGISEDGR
jgi:hypothetical protein